MTEPTPDDGELVVTVDGPVATLWLNRPDKRNAVTHQMWRGIADACERVEADDSLTVLVVRGVGRHFCAGADIGGLNEPGYRDTNAEAERRLAELAKPAVALVAGACVGGGMQIATACDLRIAETTTRIGVTPARLGIVYPATATARLVALGGPSVTKHLLFTAELIDADRALRSGLVDEVHPEGEASARVAELTALMAEQRSLLTQMASKEMVAEVLASGAVSTETERRWTRAVAASDDPAEGAAAFAQGRPPSFSWRPDRPRR